MSDRDSAYRVLGIITARGGSKGFPGKNLVHVLGKPLLQYTAEAALAATRLDRVILSTDDEKIAETGRQCGLDVPFMRPPELASDNTPTLPVLQHAVGYFEGQGSRFDAVCLLQPTSPTRRAQDIDACVRLLETSGADSVISTLPVPTEYNPHWVFYKNDQGLLRLVTGETEPIPRRQDLPEVFHREGSIYLVRTNVLMKQSSLYGQKVVGYPMDLPESINIDAPPDLAKAEAFLKSRSSLNETVGNEGGRSSC